MGAYVFFSRVGHVGEPEDVRGAVIFLTSTAADLAMVTTLMIDGSCMTRYAFIWKSLAS